MNEVGSKRKTGYIVLADTSFLLTPYDFKINIIEGLERIMEGKYELVVPSFCIKELEDIMKRGFIKRKKAQLALELVKKHARIINVPLMENERVDDALVRIAKEMRAIVATGDREIRKKLRKEGIPVVFVRARKKLELEGELY
ncbi:MAG: 30S processome protein Utp24 [Thermoprotei archaeon]|nr:MAG: 30S processome protein Utp24 [Thermoprotei archaeon]